MKMIVKIAIIKKLPFKNLNKVLGYAASNTKQIYI